MKFQHLPPDQVQNPFPSVSSVWIRPTTGVFSWEDIQTLFLAFEPRKCIAHRSWSGKFQSPIEASEDEISRTDMRLNYLKTNSLCNSRWVNIDSEAESVDSFLEGNARRSAPSFAFFPRDLPVGHLWSKVSQGLWWLWDCERYVNSHPEPIFDADAALESFVKMTLHLGGFPGLCWSDWDTDMGIAFWMPTSHALDLGRNLQNLGAVEENLWSNLSKIGFLFELSRSRLGYQGE